LDFNNSKTRLKEIIMKRSLVLLVMVLLVVSVFSTGCCSIMSGSTQRVTISSDPPGATVKADDGTTIVTPGALTLVRKHEHTLVAEMPGHEPQQQKLVKKLNNWIWLNPIIDFGIFSIPIDFMTGSADELNPKEVHFNFKSAQKASVTTTVPEKQ